MRSRFVVCLKHWFEPPDDKDLNTIPWSSHIHPAVIKAKQFSYRALHRHINIPTHAGRSVVDCKREISSCDRPALTAKVPFTEHISITVITLHSTADVPTDHASMCVWWRLARCQTLAWPTAHMRGRKRPTELPQNRFESIHISWAVQSLCACSCFINPIF